MYERGTIAARVGALALAALLLAACGGSNSSQPAAMGCTQGQVISCICPGGQTSTATCAAGGAVFQPCVCPAAGTGGTGPLQSGVGGAQSGTGVGTGGVIAAQPGTGGVPAMTGTAGVKGTGGALAMTGTGGMPGTGGTMMGTGGMTGTGGAMGTGGATGTAGSGSPDLEMLRQLCVDTINMYRMMAGVPALKRGTAAQEMCSDKGAMSDGTTMQAHASAGSCPGLGGQNTCPGWGVGGFSGNATVADALTKCLMQMWGEGMPPVSRQMCIADYQGCFLKYGHYLNMSDPSYSVVSCGFFKMSNGSWWMNQDFGH